MKCIKELTLALGVAWYGNSGLAPCPACQSERRDDQRGLSIRAEGGALLAFCHKTGCDFRDIVRAAGLPRYALRIDPQAAREADAKREAYAAKQLAKARRLWASCKPLAGTKGETYLRGRSITCPLPASLGWVADAFHGPSARRLSATVGKVPTGGQIHHTGPDLGRPAQFRCPGFRGAFDIVLAGYPCQPFSAAGKRSSANEPCHLWPEVARVIRECSPEWVFLENVAGHVTLGLEPVLRELCAWSCCRRGRYSRRPRAGRLGSLHAGWQDQPLRLQGHRGVSRQRGTCRTSGTDRAKSAYAA